MVRLLHLFRTSIGSKLVVGATGLLLFGFLLIHMIGNLKILQGPGALNDYAAWLQGHPLLWVFRVGLLGLFGLHVLTALRLALENRRVRPDRYRVTRHSRSTVFSRTMVVTGGLVLLFLIYHLLHLTLGAVGPDFSALPPDPQGRVDVYARVVTSFDHPEIAGLYLVAMGLLGFHLTHAIPSLLQTLGFNHESYETLIQVLSPMLAWAVALGFAAVPLLAGMGLLTPPGGA
jgi:succinate dehydrogenase / fumarate reductase cytochrome b subunit